MKKGICKVFLRALKVITEIKPNIKIMSEDKVTKKIFAINSTEPKMPTVELWMNANIVPPKGASKTET